MTLIIETRAVLDKFTKTVDDLVKERYTSLSDLHPLQRASLFLDAYNSLSPSEKEILKSYLALRYFSLLGLDLLNSLMTSGDFEDLFQKYALGGLLLILMEEFKNA